MEVLPSVVDAPSKTALQRPSGSQLWRLACLLQLGIQQLTGMSLRPMIGRYFPFIFFKDLGPLGVLVPRRTSCMASGAPPVPPCEPRPRVSSPKLPMPLSSGAQRGCLQACQAQPHGVQHVAGNSSEPRPGAFATLDPPGPQLRRLARSPPGAPGAAAPLREGRWHLRAPSGLAHLGPMALRAPRSRQLPGSTLPARDEAVMIDFQPTCRSSNCDTHRPHALCRPAVFKHSEKPFVLVQPVFDLNSL